MNNNLINVVNLVKNFDEQSVIKNISFNVKKNSIVGILGKNGAGKTTLLGMLLGLITPTKGDIYIFGKNLKLNKKEITNGIQLFYLLLKIKYANSKSESRKLIRGRGVKLNGRVVTDELFVLSCEEMLKEENIVSVGKKKHFKVIVE